MMRYVGNWRAQTLGQLFSNWLLACMTSPLKQNTARGPQGGGLPICCLETYSRNLVGMSFVTLLVFACVPTLRDETGCWQIHNRHCDECDLHVQDKNMSFTCAHARKCAICQVSVRRKFAKQFADFTGADTIYNRDMGASYFNNMLLRM